VRGGGRGREASTSERPAGTDGPHGGFRNRPVGTDARILHAGLGIVLLTTGSSGLFFGIGDRGSMRLRHLLHLCDFTCGRSSRRRPYHAPWPGGSFMFSAGLVELCLPKHRVLMAARASRRRSSAARSNVRASWSRCGACRRASENSRGKSAAGVPRRPDVPSSSSSSPPLSASLFGRWGFRFGLDGRLEVDAARGRRRARGAVVPANWSSSPFHLARTVAYGSGLPLSRCASVAFLSSYRRCMSRSASSFVRYAVIPASSCQSARTG